MSHTGMTKFHWHAARTLVGWRPEKGADPSSSLTLLPPPALKAKEEKDVFNLISSLPFTTPVMSNLRAPTFKRGPAARYNTREQLESSALEISQTSLSSLQDALAHSLVWRRPNNAARCTHRNGRLCWLRTHPVTCYIFNLTSKARFMLHFNYCYHHFPFRPLHLLCTVSNWKKYSLSNFIFVTFSVDLSAVWFKIFQPLII